MLPKALPVGRPASHLFLKGPECTQHIASLYLHLEPNNLNQAQPCKPVVRGPPFHPGALGVNWGREADATAVGDWGLGTCSCHLLTPYIHAWAGFCMLRFHLTLPHCFWAFQDFRTCILTRSLNCICTFNYREVKRGVEVRAPSRRRTQVEVPKWETEWEIQMVKERGSWDKAKEKVKG